MYEEFLRRLLEPLGVYDLREGTLNTAELAALGVGLDHVAERLDTAEREALAATAEADGLRRREALFLRRSAAGGLETLPYGMVRQRTEKDRQRSGASKVIFTWKVFSPLPLSPFSTPARMASSRPWRSAGRGTSKTRFRCLRPRITRKS